MIIGGLSVYLRAIPERSWEWLVEQTTLMITVKDDDAAFVWVKEWFLEAHRDDSGTGEALVLVSRKAVSCLLLPD